MLLATTLLPTPMWQHATVSRAASGKRVGTRWPELTKVHRNDVTFSLPRSEGAEGKEGSQTSLGKP